MRVKRVWKCECGATKILIEAHIHDSSSYILKGDGFFSHDPLSKAARIICCQCSDKYEVLRPIVKANGLVKLWQCRCMETKLLKSVESKDLLIQGLGFPYGSPTTQIRCGGCGDSYRVAPTVIYASHLALKKKPKRAKRKKGT